MSKKKATSRKKATKQVTKLNPEKFIREKGRSLPIYKCWIDGNWKTVKQGNIIIAREHANGNLTTCFYLADLGCLGVKDTFYAVNRSDNEIFSKISENPNLIEVSYELVHNIILSAVEYAEDLGFEPHPIFTKTTSFFLEEDNDDIALIPIQCGDEEGKPIYMSAEHDSQRKKNQIIAHLEKTVGKGNFHFIIGRNLNEDEDDEYDDEDEYDDDEYDDDEEYDDEYDDEEEDEEYKEFKRIEKEMYSLSKDEQIKLFLALANVQDEKDLQIENLQKLGCLADLLTYGFIKMDDLDDEYRKLENDMEHPTVEVEDFPDSLFAEIEVDDENKGSFIDLFWDTFDVIEEIEEDQENRKVALEKFKEALPEAPLVPLVCYFELLYLEKINITEYEEQLEKYHLQYPDYFLIQVLWHTVLCQKDGITLEEKRLRFEDQRQLLSQCEDTVSIYEYDVFVCNYILSYMAIIAEYKQDKQQTLVNIIAITAYLRKYNFISKRLMDKVSLLVFTIQIEILSILLEDKKIVKS
jgi:hypothetical protein